MNWFRGFGVFWPVACFFLASCDLAGPKVPDTKPQARPAGLTRPAQTPSENSQALARYYQRLENDLLGRDFLRIDGGGSDTPYSDAHLARNFERIAFYDEYQRDQGMRASDGLPGQLKKWAQPVRIKVEFGPGVSQEERLRDRRNVADYAARLSHLTGHSITLSDRNPNFTVMIMSADDRDLARRRALEIMPNFKPANMVFFSNLPRSVHCFVIAAGYENEYEYRVALSYIRAENTPLQRLACIHEELAQGLGLANDSPHARPTIFNDDDEFALLTRHDEELLRILYNPALKPGMTLQEARPVIAQIIADRPGPF